MILLYCSVDCFMWVPALLRRVKRTLPISGGDRGINYNSVRVKRGVWTSTVTVTAEDKAGVPFPWSGKEFRVESSEGKRSMLQPECSLVIPTFDIQLQTSMLLTENKARLGLWQTCA